MLKIEHEAFIIKWPHTQAPLGRPARISPKMRIRLPNLIGGGTRFEDVCHYPNLYWLLAADEEELESQENESNVEGYSWGRIDALKWLSDSSGVFHVDVGWWRVSAVKPAAAARAQASALSALTMSK